MIKYTFTGILDSAYDFTDVLGTGLSSFTDVIFFYENQAFINNKIQFNFKNQIYSSLFYINSNCIYHNIF